MKAALIALLVVVAYYAVPWLYMRWLRNRARARCRKHGKVILTFDDGPSDVLSDRILACLDQHNVHAAHFVTTSNIHDREDKIRAQAARGDVVGCHGHAHVHHWKTAPWAGVQDIRKGWARLGELTGVDCRRAPFRPPYGKLNLISLIYLLVHRTPIAVWTLDSGDTAASLTQTPQHVVDRVQEERGGIVLLHDYDREDPAVNDFVIETVTALMRQPGPGIRVTDPTTESFR